MRKMQEQFSAKESIQRKGDPDAACFLRSVVSGFARKDIPVLLAKCGFPAAPLLAIPDKNASTRRGIRGGVHILYCVVSLK
jgi:hypothetical protein